MTKKQKEAIIARESGRLKNYLPLIKEISRELGEKLKVSTANCCVGPEKVNNV